MKILIATPYFYPSVGGVQNYVRSISLGLKQDYNHDIIIVTSGEKGGSVVRQRYENMIVYRLPIQFKLSNTPFSLMWKSQIKQIILEENPAVVIAHTPVPFMADMVERAALGKPFILTYHNDLTKSDWIGNLLAKTFYLLFTRRTMKRSYQIVATSEYYLNDSTYLQGYKDKIAIVPPGIDTGRFNGEVDKTWLKKKYPGKKLVLFVGSMDEAHSHKGVDVLIKAIAQVREVIPSIQLVAVGGGGGVRKYQQLAKELGVANIIDFTGFISDSDLPKYYAGSDVFVLPSLTTSEGFGMVLIEASACGTPVIGSNVGGISQALEDGQDGMLVRANNLQELSHAISTILSNPKLALHLGAHGQRKVKASFPWSLQVSKTARIVKELVS